MQETQRWALPGLSGGRGSGETPQPTPSRGEEATNAREEAEG